MKKLKLNSKNEIHNICLHGIIQLDTQLMLNKLIFYETLYDNNFAFICVLPSKPLNHTTTQSRHTMYLRSIGLVAHV